MNYCNIKYHAVEDGIGLRTVLFVSGCRHHCKGCFQPETWNFDYGQPFTDKTENMIIDSLNDPYVSGLTLLGGEPFEPENQATLVNFVKKIKTLYPDKTIWAYSGFTFEELIDENNSACHTENTIAMLKKIDVLIDGRFVEEKRNLMLPYRGSENQRIINVPASLEANRAILSKYHNRNR
ncbi:anaerobic ribonucleoside-triphosphate reductase activating protein [bacterium]|nr:anaerobic ribonucleoside-triphosphate reductase activating protein [bacterium]